MFINAISIIKYKTSPTNIVPGNDQRKSSSSSVVEKSDFLKDPESDSENKVSDLEEQLDDVLSIDRVSGDEEEASDNVRFSIDCRDW